MHGWVLKDILKESEAWKVICPRFIPGQETPIGFRVIVFVSLHLLLQTQRLQRGLSFKNPQLQP